MRNWSLREKYGAVVVLEAYMLRYNVPHEYFRDVIVMNSVMDQELWDLLQNRVQNLPTTIQNEINAVLILNPDYETVAELDNKIINERSLSGLYLYEMMKFQLFDSNLLTELIALNGAGKDVLLDYHMMQGNLNAAQSALNGWSTTNPEQIVYKDWIQWQLNILNSGRSLQEINASELVELQEFYSNYDTGYEVKTWAKCLLHANGKEVQTWVPTLNYTFSHKPYLYFSVESDPEYLLYPNPADNYTIVEYTLKENEQGLITLRDILGKLVSSQRLNLETTQNVLTLDNLAPGNYTVEIIINNERKWQEKLVVH